MCKEDEKKGENAKEKVSKGKEKRKWEVKGLYKKCKRGRNSDKKGMIGVGKRHVTRGGKILFLEGGE
jgi:hypothetical protein